MFYELWCVGPWICGGEVQSLRWYRVKARFQLCMQLHLSFTCAYTRAAVSEGTRLGMALRGLLASELLSLSPCATHFLLFLPFISIKRTHFIVTIASEILEAQHL